MRVIKFLALFILTVIIGVFAAHNDTLAPINFYPFDLQVSIAVFLLVIGATLIGVIMAGLVCGAKIISYRRVIRQQRREIEKLKTTSLDITV